MTESQSLIKRARLDELSNGKFRLLEAGKDNVPVCDIEFNNAKAARNWGRSRGIHLAEAMPDGSTAHGAN